MNTKSYRRREKRLSKLPRHRLSKSSIVAVTIDLIVSVAILICTGALTEAGTPGAEPIAAVIACLMIFGIIASTMLLFRKRSAIFLGWIHTVSAVVPPVLLLYLMVAGEDLSWVIVLSIQSIFWMPPLAFRIVVLCLYISALREASKRFVRIEDVLAEPSTESSPTPLPASPARTATAPPAAPRVAPGPAAPERPKGRNLLVTAVSLDLLFSAVLVAYGLGGSLVLPFTESKLGTPIALAIIGGVGILAGMLLLQEKRGGIFLGWARVALTTVSPVLLFLNVFGEMGGAGPIVFALSSVIWMPLLAFRAVVSGLYIAALIRVSIQLPRSEDTPNSVAPRLRSGRAHLPLGPFIVTVLTIDLVQAAMGLMTGIFLLVVGLLFDTPEGARALIVLLTALLTAPSVLGVWANTLILKRRSFGIILGWIRVTCVAIVSVLWVCQAHETPPSILALVFRVVVPILYIIMLLQLHKLSSMSTATARADLPPVPD
jgi:hypothetical protein